MEDTQNTKTKKKNRDWLALLMGGVFGNFQSLVDGIFGSVGKVMQAFTLRIARHVLLSLFAFLGIVFLLVGLAQFFSARYPLPGAGEALVGAGILFITLLFYAFTKDS